MNTVISILDGLAAIPAILGYVEKFAQAVSLWYVTRQTTETFKEISDAAALSARAKTPEDRSLALSSWRSALSRSRIKL